MYLFSGHKLVSTRLKKQFFPQKLRSSRKETYFALFQSKATDTSRWGAQYSCSVTRVSSKSSTHEYEYRPGGLRSRHEITSPISLDLWRAGTESEVQQFFQSDPFAVGNHLHPVHPGWECTLQANLNCSPSGNIVVCHHSPPGIDHCDICLHIRG